MIKRRDKKQFISANSRLNAVYFLPVEEIPQAREHVDGASKNFPDVESAGSSHFGELCSTSTTFERLSRNEHGFSAWQLVGRVV